MLNNNATTCFQVQNNKLIKFDQTKNLGRSISIPKGISVIGAKSFQSCLNIETLIIPDSVKIIEEGAFQSCVNLKSVMLPYGLEQIEDNTFSGCQSISSIELPKSLKTIGKGIFSGCKRIKPIEFSNNLISYSFRDGFEVQNDCLTFFDQLVNPEQNLRVPYGITIIGEKAFYKCNNLIVVTLPTSVKEIKNSAFADCTSLCILDFPLDINNFGRCIFSNCKQLMPIKVPNRLTSYYFVNGMEIHDRCLTFFDQNINKDQHVIIPHGVTSIGQNAFFGCTNVKSITFPKNFRMIEEGAFAGAGLTEMTIPEGVVSIEKHTFYKCFDLRQINIPNSVKYIDEKAFEGCPNLENDVIPGKGKGLGNYYSLEQVKQ